MTTRRLQPDRALRTERNGRILLGGQPFRVMTLSTDGATAVRSWFAGQEPEEGSEAGLAARLVDSGIAHPVVEPRVAHFHVVVPFRGTSDGLATTLETLEAESITVVDDGSNPPIPQIEGVDVLRHPTSRGPAAARNTGWRHLVEKTSDTGDLVVLFVDGGVSVAPGALQALAGHFDDPAVAAAAPRVASAPGPSVLERYEMSFSPLDLGPHPSLVGPDRPVTYVPTACLAVRASSLIELDGFDETFRYGEDVDLVWRIAEEHQVRYEPTAVVHHRPRASALAFAEQRFRYATAAAPLASKHTTTGSPWRPSLAGAAGVVASVLGHTWLGMAIGFLPTRRLAARLSTTATPVSSAVRLSGLAHGWAARSFAENVGRSWFVPTIVLAARPSFRRRAMMWLIAGWLRRASTTRSPVMLGFGVLDDVAYGVGTAVGAYRERSLRTLLPSITRWA